MSQLPERPPMAGRPTLYRSPRGRMVAGICAGLAERTGLNAWIFRIIFIIGTFTFGPGLIAYLVMWALMPLDRS